MKLSASTVLLSIIFSLLFCTIQICAYLMFVDGKEIQLSQDLPALYQYIEAPDSSFHWEGAEEPYNVDTINRLNVFRVKYTSLRWLTEEDVDLSLWKHDVLVIVPFDLKFQGVGVAYISQCTTDDMNCVSNQYAVMAPMFAKMKTVVILLAQVPNQKMVFTSDPLKKSRVEDQIIAYTWRKAVEFDGARPDWICFFPMVKATVGVLTVLEQWSTRMLGKYGITDTITQFYPFGASKRGETVWLASAYLGARDRKRIIASSPIIFDDLNFKKAVSSVYQSLGGWSYPLKDYIEEGIIDYLPNPRIDEILLRHFDPFAPWYQEGLNLISKNIISASQDQFFLITNDKYYYNEISNKVRLIIPGTDHSLIDGLQYMSASVVGHLHSHINPNFQLPRQISQVDRTTGTITWNIWPKPSSVTVFFAESNPSSGAINRLDFRLYSLPNADEPKCTPPSTLAANNLCLHRIPWNTIVLKGIHDTTSEYWQYTYTHKNVPTDGRYVAVFLMALWDNTITGSQLYTTPSMVLPDTMPFKDCFLDKSCTPTLV